MGLSSGRNSLNTRQIPHPLGEPSLLRFQPMTKPKRAKAFTTESPWPFEVDPHPIEETLTAFGGIPLVVQTFCSLGLPQCWREQAGSAENGSAATMSSPRWRAS